MKFKSPIVTSKLNCEEIFYKISNLNDLKDLLPKEINEYSSTNETCSFKIDNLPKINLKIKDKISFEKISLIAIDSQVPFKMNCHFKEINKITNVYFEIDAEINFMMKIVVEKPLVSLLDKLSSKVKDL